MYIHVFIYIYIYIYMFFSGGLHIQRHKLIQLGRHGISPASLPGGGAGPQHEVRAVRGKPIIYTSISSISLSLSLFIYIYI